LDTSKVDLKTARFLASMYCDHVSILLGSGWVRNTYGTICRGLEEHVYQSGLGNLRIDKNGEWLSKILPKTYTSH